MGKEHWKIGDLPWDRFDRSLVDPELLKLVKAASMVEFGGRTFGTYLRNVFFDDAAFKKDVETWALEEVQHGNTLGRYAALADPAFDFGDAYARYTQGYSIKTDTAASVRGSRSGELVARCMVEIGTSSYYTALGGAAREPLLKEICGNIARDEFRHYAMFYEHLQRYLARDRIGRPKRFRIILGRLLEAEDDELPYAYFASNAAKDSVYNREDCIRAYEARAFPLYTWDIVRHAIALMFKACGYKPYSFAQSLGTRAAWGLLRRKARQAKKSR